MFLRTEKSFYFFSFVSKSFQGYFTVQLSRFFRYILLLLFSDNLFNISSSYFLVNNFFIIFKKIKRRRRDLNPRAGFPTYTLSRGTSSATWVLLLVRIFLVFYKTKFVFYLFCAVTQSILYALDTLLSTKKNFFFKFFIFS